MAVDVLISGPATAAFDLTDQAGDIMLTGVQGVVKTDVQAGRIELNTVTLASGSQIKTNVGAIAINGQLAPGASVSVTDNVGSVEMTLPSSTNTYLSATTDTGSIAITGWTVQQSSNGASHTATGDLGTGSSGTLTIHVGTGSITLSQG
jgi:hypothetical protein